MNKVSTKKTIAGFFITALLGVLMYFILIKILFKPDFLALFDVGVKLLNNLGNPHLKLKAYIAFIGLVAPLTMYVIWWIMPKNSTSEDYGSASFAKESDFERMGINHKEGLILGTLMHKGEYKLIRATKPLSSLVVASPGSGKTAGIIIPNLLSVPNSCIVTDIKGELYAKTAGYRQKHFNNEIQLFSPFSWDNTLFFNPFDKSIVEKMQYIHIKKLAEQIASTIFVAEKGKESDHWVTSAKTLFVFFAEYFMQKKQETSLFELYQAPKADYFDFIDEEYYYEVTEENEDDPNNRTRSQDNNLIWKTWLKQTSFDESIDENTRNQARAYQSISENEFGSIKSTFDTYMKVFSNPQVANATSKMSFSFEDLREKRISMYIVIQTEDMDILAPLVRIFIESLFKRLMSGEECGDKNKFIYCFLDEFVRFGKMPFLLEAPALCRSYGLLPVFVTQSYEQIKKYYGEDDMNIIKNNSGYQVIFTMNSEKDAKDTSELIGDFTHEKKSVSKGNLDLFKSNASLSKEGKKLVSAQDLKNMSNEDLLVLVKGFYKHPIQCKVPYWFKNKNWNGADSLKVLSEEELKEQTENEDNESALLDVKRDDTKEDYEKLGIKAQ
ncbi:type IV secretory system conjugative DNA transfer family protein [Campylobacter cuniculorum]|uniref:Type IV secretion system, coupling protein VirD4 n=2 Tax=Campylobacter cuniculorum TaxID=374106 RepID=A0A1W6BYH4_9BACT|nr:type IV secretory system conjugative DNA transfer family protein [Campylobacter cuniculorum]ARJ57135.1 type IV secretion system, coupling protein VirD4 [Campylobacter cuniculorum DSM 23162 = LMG 24588]QOR04578.1 type IV secretory system conjugative DNA transfer family protein [Campylobacter cuniculorum]